MPDFFVTGEQQSHWTMRKVWMLDQPRRQLDNDRHTCLVVGAQQGCSIGCDKRTALQTLQFWIVGNPNHLGVVSRQNDVAATIFPDNLRSDIRSSCFGRCIEVCVESNGWSSLTGSGRYGTP